jgi:hypothetical protein
MADVCQNQLTSLSAVATNFNRTINPAGTTMAATLIAGHINHGRGIYL